MKFSKWHGLGNDFVIINGFEETITDFRQAAIEICDRHFGIGADGLVAVLPSAVADFAMRIFNADGSEAEMCGNVTRCVARYVFESGMTDQRKITLETKAGMIRPELILSARGEVEKVTVDMGQPRLRPEEIPMTVDSAEPVVSWPLTVNNKNYYVTCVSMGNPHTILFVEDVLAVDLPVLGSAIETAAVFPRKTNVEFVQVVNREHLKMRVWERGAGVTLACGTGACATLVAAVLNGKADRRATIELEGGELFIEWKENNHVYMSGPATEVFRGCYI
jgi:diaminopimelate epimerase